MLSRTIPQSVHTLVTRHGVSIADATALRKISMTLQRWFELECGTDAGHIERDEKTGKPYFRRVLEYGPHRTHLCDPIADRESGARRRLARIMASYPHLVAYVQTDPRGAALYILDRKDIPEGATLDSCYSRGTAVFK